MAWTIPEAFQYARAEAFQYARAEAPHYARAMAAGRGWRRLAPLLLCLALAAGCSSTTFFYNRLDFLVPWYVDDYVELNAEQDRELERRLEPFLDWHRYEELPRYVALLEQAGDMLQDGLSLAEAEELTRAAERAGNRVQTRSLDWLLPMGAALSDDQVEEFIANLRDKQEELEEEYLERDLEEYREDAYDNLVENSQDYLGRLDDRQRDVLEMAAESLQRSDHLWLQERAAWIDRLEQLLQRQPGWQDAVRQAVAQRWERSSEEYRGMYRNNLGVIQQALVTVINHRSERQDQRLQRELSGLREDFLALSREGQGSGEAGDAVAP